LALEFHRRPLASIAAHMPRKQLRNKGYSASNRVLRLRHAVTKHSSDPHRDLAFHWLRSCFFLPPGSTTMAGVAKVSVALTPELHELVQEAVATGIHQRGDAGGPARLEGTSRTEAGGHPRASASLG
jgi:hypothetical protein